jgi:hypothetical protein
VTTCVDPQVLQCLLASCEELLKLAASFISEDITAIQVPFSMVCVCVCVCVCLCCVSCLSADFHSITFLFLPDHTYRHHWDCAAAWVLPFPSPSLLLPPFSPFLTFSAPTQQVPVRQVRPIAKDALSASQPPTCPCKSFVRLQGLSAFLFFGLPLGVPADPHPLLSLPCSPGVPSNIYSAKRASKAYDISPAFQARREQR